MIYFWQLNHAQCSLLLVADAGTKGKILTMRKGKTLIL